jgi:hypothetical protein
METQKLELFAIIELFGHTSMTGKVTEQTVGSDSFVRIDVPETDHHPAYTRLLNPKAIYAINPVTEDVMLDMARMLTNMPIQNLDINKIREKILAIGNNEHEWEEE